MKHRSRSRSTLIHRKSTKVAFRRGRSPSEHELKNSRGWIQLGRTVPPSNAGVVDWGSVAFTGVGNATLLPERSGGLMALGTGLGCAKGEAAPSSRVHG